MSAKQIFATAAVLSLCLVDAKGAAESKSKYAAGPWGLVQEGWDVLELVKKLDEGKGHHFHPDLYKDHPKHRAGTPVV